MLRPAVRSRSLYGVLLTLFLLISAAVPAAAEETVREIHVEVRNFSFVPDVINVTPGEKVRFVVRNTSNAYHTFTLALSPQNRESPLADLALQAGQTGSASVIIPSNATGLYLFCRPHELVPMIAKVSVSGQAAPEQPKAAPTALPKTGDGSLTDAAPARLTSAIITALLVGGVLSLGLKMVRRER